MKNAAGVVLGYLTMVVLVMVGLSALYLGLGADRAFRPGSYDVSLLWSGISLVVGLVAAVVGGWVCARIAGTRAAVTSLAALVLVLGILFAVPSLMTGDVALAARGGEVGNWEAMQSAVTPLWVAILTPIVGAVGIFLGGRVPPAEDEVLPL